MFVTSLIEPEEALGSTAPLGYAVAAETRDQLAEELAVEVARRADMLGVEVSFVRGMGDAVHVLTEVAHSHRADMMVVGRSAKMLHRLAGSVGRPPSRTQPAESGHRRGALRNTRRQTAARSAEALFFGRGVIANIVTSSSAAIMCGSRNGIDCIGSGR